MLHPHEFLLHRTRLPESALPILRRTGSVTRLTLLFANYADRSEVVAYATAVYSTDGSVLIEPPLDLKARFFGEAQCVLRGLTAIATLSAALIEGVSPRSIYRADGLGTPTHPDAYLDSCFADVDCDTAKDVPAEFLALAKLDLADPDLPKLRKPELKAVRDGHALMTMAKMACELIEKPALWHVADDGDGDDVKSVRLGLAVRLAGDCSASRALYHTAGRSRTYRRADVRSTRFAGR